MWENEFVESMQGICQIYWDIWEYKYTCLLKKMVSFKKYINDALCAYTALYIRRADQMCVWRVYTFSAIEYNNSVAYTRES